MKSEQTTPVEKTLHLLNEHYKAFFSIAEIARETGHPVPMDTRGWSQLIVSVLTGIKGLERRKGPDLTDGSDVKGANTWEAIDTPRFNGVIKAGTQAGHSDSMKYLDDTPALFLVLWDIKALEQHRCRIWAVRPKFDPQFRKICQKWYDARASGKIRSSNFQLHPPRGKDTNKIRNSFGNLSYPLLFSAVRGKTGFTVESHAKNVLINGLCTKA